MFDVQDSSVLDKGSREPADEIPSSDEPIQVPNAVLAAENELLSSLHLRMLRFDPRPEVFVPTALFMCETLMTHEDPVVRNFAGAQRAKWARMYPEYVE